MADPVDDLAALRRVAEAAGGLREDHEDWWRAAFFEGVFPREYQKADAAFIEEASPALILAILARLEAAERVCEAVVGLTSDRTETGGWNIASSSLDLLTIRVAAWRATQQETPDAPR